MNGAEQRVQARVRRPLFGRKLEVQGDGVEAREEPAGEIGHRELEHRRAHQLRETGQDGGAARRCCRETEPSARSRHLERLVTHAYTEMMNLVDDNEIEPVTDLSHMSIRALERGHRHRRQVTSGIEQLIVRRIPSMRGLPR
jgi:hypothetical protein